jgi:hypothetical protein
MAALPMPTDATVTEVKVMPWKDRFDKFVIYKKKPTDRYRAFFDDYSLEQRGYVVKERQIVFPDGTPP